MIPVFVLSLPDCHDRRARISAALNDLGLPFEFVDAVDGRRGLPPEYESQIDRPLARKLGRNLSDAEFACALSHINIYRRIVSDNIGHALVLEDDAVPHPDLARYLAGKHYEDASLTQLVCNRTVAYVRRSGVESVFDNYRSYQRAPKINLSGTSGYVISRHAAKHFVENALPITCTADWPDCIEALVVRRHCRFVFPPLVLHSGHGGVSLINQAGRERNKDERRFLGGYIPPFRNMANSYRRAPLKLFCKRLRRSEM